MCVFPDRRVHAQLLLLLLLQSAEGLLLGFSQAVRLVVVTLLTHVFFCERQASQCLTPAKAAAASVVGPSTTAASSECVPELELPDMRRLQLKAAAPLMASSFFQHSSSIRLIIGLFPTPNSASRLHPLTRFTVRSCVRVALPVFCVFPGDGWGHRLLFGFLAWC